MRKKSPPTSHSTVFEESRLATRQHDYTVVRVSSNISIHPSRSVSRIGLQDLGQASLHHSRSAIKIKGDGEVLWFEQFFARPRISAQESTLSDIVVDTGRVRREQSGFLWREPVMAEDNRRVSPAVVR
jgi:hypothetical protein